MKEYSFLNAKDDEWNYLINNSAQGSTFVDKLFLKIINENFKRYILKKKNVVKAGIVILLDNKNKIITNKFQIYSGILFYHEKNISLTSKIADEIKTTEIICEFLLSKYSNIILNSHYNFQDLRPIQWLEFDKKIKNLNINIKYTGLLNIESFKNESNYNKIFNYSILNKNKKEIIRDFENKKINFKSNFSKDNYFLVESYENMKKNNDLQWTNKDISELDKLTDNLLNNNKGIINYISDANNNLIYSTLYSWHQNTGYYLYGGRKSKKKDDWSGTISHWEMFKYLSKEKKIKIIDLEGVNSPKRGHFKTSFGAQIKPYYHISFIKK